MWTCVNKTLSPFVDIGMPNRHASIPKRVIISIRLCTSGLHSRIIFCEHLVGKQVSALLQGAPLFAVPMMFQARLLK
jgi:hypothetical protein